MFIHGVSVNLGDEIRVVEKLENGTALTVVGEVTFMRQFGEGVEISFGDEYHTEIYDDANVSVHVISAADVEKDCE